MIYNKMDKNFNINNFNDFINESKIRVFDQLSDVLIDKFDKGEYEFIIPEYSKTIRNRKIKIKNLKVSFSIQKGSNYICNSVLNITDSKIVDEYLMNPSITFYIEYIKDDKEFTKYIHSVIKHEILHLYQSYYLKLNNKFKPESWVIGSLLPTFRRFLRSEYSEYILNLLYYSLSHEIYSQLEQYYFYKYENSEYQKIKNIVRDLENFKIKKNLSEIEKSEIENIKKFILGGLLKNSNKKYNKDASNSLWNESYILKFLEKLKDYFKDKSDLIKSKIYKIDNELDFDNKISESIDKWISLPSDYDRYRMSKYDIVEELLLDIHNF